MSTLVTSPYHDYSADALSGITDIDVSSGGTITFAASQFDDVQIAKDVNFISSSFASSTYIVIKWTATQDFAAPAYWAFDSNFWGTVRLKATAGAEVIFGTEKTDLVEVSGADTVYAGGSYDYFLFASPSDVSAGAKLYGGIGGNAIELQGGGTYDLTQLEIYDVANLMLDGASSNAVITAAQLTEFSSISGAGYYMPPPQTFTIQGGSIDFSGIKLYYWDQVTAVLNGGTGDDTLTGSSYGDALNGGDGIDQLSGGEGDDKLDGGAGDDTLSGGGGNDTLAGGDGLDTLSGGGGNDTYILSSVTDVGSVTSPQYVYDTISELPGQGTDTVQIERSGPIAGYTLGDNIENGQVFGSDAYTLVGNSLNNRLTANGAGNQLRGGAGNDVLFGGVGSDDLRGNVGNDRLSAGGGSDTLSGGDGNDLLSGGGGSDTLDGGAGQDTLRGGAGADHLVGGGGSDTADYSASASAVNVNLATGKASGGDAQGDTLSDIDNLLGSSFGDALTGDIQANRIDGGGGDDKIAGGAGNDVILASLGHDTLDGGLGTDLLNFAANFTAGATLDLGMGTVDLGSGNSATIFGFESVLGTTGSDQLTGSIDADQLSGNGGDDRLFGLGANDVLIGGLGNDILSGGGGADRLIGGDGDDTLDGGGGADRLIAGAGRDKLTGGAGKDVFEIKELGDSGSLATLRDTITDFVKGDDRIDLSAIDAIASTAADDSFTLIGTSGFHGNEGELRVFYSSDKSATLISGDVDGNGSGDFQVRLTGHFTLSTPDFIL